MLRFFDIVISIIGLLVLSPLLTLVTLIVICENSSPLFMQKRIGINKKLFIMVKFRTMRSDTPSIATHLIDQSAITPFGRLLRYSKLDELPQLWNVLVGDMSLVGPRPCLPNQTDIISGRMSLGLFRVRPGMTGLAQVRRIDMSNSELLLRADSEMVSSLNVLNYFKYIVLTVACQGIRDRVCELKISRDD